MTAGELATAAGAADPAADVKVTAIFNEPMDQMLSRIASPQIADTSIDGDGKFVVNLSSFNLEFRIRAPYNTALDEQLIGSNVKNTYIDVDKDTIVFEIDT